MEPFIGWMLALGFIAGLLATMLVTRERNRMYYLAFALVMAIGLLVYAAPDVYPPFLPRLAVQNILLISVPLLFLYSIFPNPKASKRFPSGRARLYWLLVAGVVLVIYFLTLVPPGGIA